MLGASWNICFCNSMTACWLWNLESVIIYFLQLQVLVYCYMFTQHSLKYISCEDFCKKKTKFIKDERRGEVYCLQNRWERLGQVATCCVGGSLRTSVSWLPHCSVFSARVPATVLQCYCSTAQLIAIWDKTERTMFLHCLLCSVTTLNIAISPVRHHQ